VAQVIEHLSSKHKTLNSNLYTTTKKKNQKGTRNKNLSDTWYIFEYSDTVIVQITNVTVVIGSVNYGALVIPQH
jgi:hypothetical protein